MIFLAIWGLFLMMGDMLENQRLLLNLLVWAIALPYLANSAGWLLTEVGRFPWVVFGLVKLEDGLSLNVTVGMLLFSLIGFILVYSILIAATIYLMRKYALAGPASIDEIAVVEADEGMPSLVAVDKS